MWVDLLQHAGRHALLSLIALALACAFGVLLGIWASASSQARTPLLAVASLGRTIPSIAILMLLLPLLGVGTAPAVVALALLGLPPILVNVDLGLRGVPRPVLDAATGLGMSARQRFTRVSVPLALPVAVSGLRTASVEVIGSTTLATFIGAGGLGDDIVRALQTGDPRLLVSATIVVAALAFAAEFVLGRIAARLGSR